jgi:riboflavin biosynthesis pyrimidine reductase
VGTSRGNAEGSRTTLTDGERDRRRAGVRKLVGEGYSRRAICDALDIGDGTLVADMAMLGIKANGKPKRKDAAEPIVWRDHPVPPRMASFTKAEQLLALLSNPNLITEVRELIADEKQARRVEAVIRAAEREVDAARLEEERRRADEEREALRMAELSRDTVDKSLLYWARVREAVDAATEVIARYLREFDHFPPLMPADVRMLERSLADLRQQVHHFDVRLHVPGATTVGEPVIDV